MSIEERTEEKREEMMMMKRCIPSFGRVRRRTLTSCDARTVMQAQFVALCSRFIKSFTDGQSARTRADLHSVGYRFLLITFAVDGIGMCSRDSSKCNAAIEWISPWKNNASFDPKEKH